jgi:hypothetical protein
MTSLEPSLTDLLLDLADDLDRSIAVDGQRVRQITARIQRQLASKDRRIKQLQQLINDYDRTEAQ